MIYSRNSVIFESGDYYNIPENERANQAPPRREVDLANVPRTCSCPNTSPIKGWKLQLLLQMRVKGWETSLLASAPRGRVSRPQYDLCTILSMSTVRVVTPQHGRWLPLSWLQLHVMIRLWLCHLVVFFFQPFRVIKAKQKIIMPLSSGGIK